MSRSASEGAILPSKQWRIGSPGRLKSVEVCKLYTYKMTAAEMRALKLHFQLIGMTWTEREECQQQQNEPIEGV